MWRSRKADDKPRKMLVAVAHQGHVTAVQPNVPPLSITVGVDAVNQVAQMPPVPENTNQPDQRQTTDAVDSR